MNVRAIALSGVLTVVMAVGVAVVWLVTQRPASPGTTGSVTAVLVGAGDIAGCEGGSDTATAQLLDRLPGTVFTLGDNAYPDGTAEQFAECYGPTWGRHRNRTRPAVGNHDYVTDGAAPYFEYFGDAAGQPGEGWYSYEAGGWHVVVLNSVCLTGPAFCSLGEQQLAWLRADLDATSAACVLAYWHTPRYSSGSEHGDTPAVQPFWDVLATAGLGVVLNGDDHHYERFAPLDVHGQRVADGIRQFIVGTGGAGLRPLGPINPRSDLQIADVHGVLRLTLRSTDYEWAFIAEPDGRVLDQGTAACA